MHIQARSDCISKMPFASGRFERIRTLLSDGDGLKDGYSGIYILKVIREKMLNDAYKLNCLRQRICLYTNMRLLAEFVCILHACVGWHL